MELTRRHFLRLSMAAGITAAGVAGGDLLGLLAASGVRIDRDARYIPSYCEMCFWKCGLVAKVADGRVVTLYGNPLHPNSRGRLCARGNAGVGLLYDEDRLKYPLISCGGRGEGRYKRASWDEALGYVAEKMDRIKTRYGPESLAFFAHGSVTAHFVPLILGFGTPNFAFPSFAQCRGPRIAAFELTFGEDPGTPERVDLAGSRVIALFGSHLGENMHNSQVQDFVEGLSKGARLIVADPRFSTAAGKAKWWLPVKPGTDTALMLAWMNVLINEDLYDRAYVERYASGFDSLRSHVGQYTPEWAASETEVPARLIVRTARELGRNRPNVCVHPGRHSSWHGNDVQRERCLAILNAILGTWGRRGGLYLKTRSSLPVPPQKEEFPEPQKPPLSGKYLSAGAEGVTNAIRDATRTGKPYPVKGWLVAGTNLLKAMPNERETAEAIRGLDLLVAIDVMPFDTAMMADVILPECTYLERHDEVYVQRDRMLTASIRQPAVPPMYQSRPGWWIARQLSVRMGLGSYYPWGTLEEKIRSECAFWKVDYGELRSKGVVSFSGTDNPYITAENQPVFGTPSGKIELYSRELEKKGFDPIPVYSRVKQPAEGWFRLIYGRSPVHTFTKTTNNERLWELFRENEAWINKGAADRLGIEGGQYIRLENQDGQRSDRVRAKVTERIRPDCIYMVHGFGSRDKSLSRAYKKGADDQGLITRYAVDPVCGSTGMRCNFVKPVLET